MGKLLIHRIRALGADSFALIGLFLLSIGLHLLPFILYGAHPLGYDTGFYRRYLIQPIRSFPNSAVPGLGDDAFVPRIFLDCLRMLHLPPDLILYGSYILLFALIPCLIFVLLRRTAGVRIALLAGLFFIASPVAYTTYWYVLFKNVFALCLLLLAFICWERKHFLPLAALDILIAFSHKTTALVYLLTLCFLFVVEKGKRVEILLHGVLTALAFLVVNMPSVREALIAPPAGVFLSWSSYLALSLPFLIFAVCGAFVMRAVRIPRIVIAFAFVSFVFVICRFPFYERIFVYCDLALAMLAAFGASASWNRFRAHAKLPKSGYTSLAILCVAAGLLCGSLWRQVASLQPLISGEAIQEIQAIGGALPPNAIVLTSADEAPWYEGWTLAHVAAPGLLQDTHNLEEWANFWATSSPMTREKFLDSFQRPLYISTLGSYQDLIGGPMDCLIPVRPHLLKDSCASIPKGR